MVSLNTVTYRGVQNCLLCRSPIGRKLGDPPVFTVLLYYLRSFLLSLISRFAVCTVGYLNILPYFRNLKVLVLHWCLWGTSFVTCLYLAKWLRGYVTRHLFVFYFFFKFKERIPKFFLSSIFSLGWALPTQCISQAQYFFYSFFYNLFIFKICNYIFFFNLRHQNTCW